MKRTDVYLLLVLSFCSSRIILADEPTLADANKLFGFAETAGTKLFFPPVQTQKVKQAGSDWFSRYFPASNTDAAININGAGPFFAGSVYISGEDFEKDPLYVDTLGGLLAAIDAIEPHLREERTQLSTKAMEIVFQKKFLLKMVSQTLRQQLFLMVNR